MKFRNNIETRQSKRIQFYRRRNTNRVSSGYLKTNNMQILQVTKPPLIKTIDNANRNSDKNLNI